MNYKPPPCLKSMLREILTGNIRNTGKTGNTGKAEKKKESSGLHRIFDGKQKSSAANDKGELIKSRTVGHVSAWLMSFKSFF